MAGPLSPQGYTMPSSAFAESDTSVSRQRFTAASQLARRGVAAVAIAAILTPASAFAIEMFTFFGDGSRVPLPSLETPIEAYPGIPLRSDRLRARRRSMRASPNGEAGMVPPGGMSIRIAPQLSVPPDPDAVLAPPPAAEPVAPPAPTRRRRWRR